MSKFTWNDNTLSNDSEFKIDNNYLKDFYTEVKKQSKINTCNIVCNSYNPMCPCPDEREFKQSCALKREYDIYFDNNSSHPVLDEVINKVIEVIKIHANPSSNHFAGQRARTEIENARNAIAKYLVVNPSTIFFTSGGTESNNIILQSHDFNCAGYEHKSVTKLCNKKETKNISLMSVNNETGVIFDLPKRGDFELIHTDMCQALGKLKQSEIREKIKNVDYASFSGHKFGAMTGIGFMYVKDYKLLTPILHGGSQEFLLKPGTYNLEGIVSLGKAIELLDDKFVDQMMELRLYTEMELKKIGCVINLESENRACNTISTQIPKYTGKDMIERLSNHGIYASYGSACNAHDTQLSNALKTFGLTNGEASSTIRISFNRFSTKEEVDIMIQTLKEAIK